MKNTTLVLVIVVVVAIIIVFAVAGGRSTNAPTISPTVTASSVVSTAPVASKKPAPTTSSVSIAYADAVKKYAGTRLQFDAQCQASPNQITIKKGTAIMLDNRSGDARTVSVGSVKYSLAGYGFRILTPTSPTLPATLLIDCGSAKNVGRINIQL